MHKAVRASWFALLDAHGSKVVRSLIASLYILFSDDFNWNTAIFHNRSCFCETEITFIISIFFMFDTLTIMFLNLKISCIFQDFMIWKLKWQNVHSMSFYLFSRLLILYIWHYNVTHVTWIKNIFFFNTYTYLIVNKVVKHDAGW